MLFASSQLAKEGMSAVLYQIYYEQKHLNKLFPFSVPYKNEGLTIFFECEPIAKIVMACKEEKVAVGSWKLAQKMRRGIHNLSTSILNSDYQVLNFITHSERHTMMAMFKVWHPGAMPAIDLLWEKLGYKRPEEAKHPMYQNHYAAKTEIYQDYCRNFLIPAMELIKTHEELNKLMMADSNYQKLSRDADIKSVKEKLGLDYYPMAPFVLERCAPLYYQMKGYRISEVPADLPFQRPDIQSVEEEIRANRIRMDLARFMKRRNR